MTSTIEHFQLDPIQAAKNSLRTGELAVLRVRQIKDNVEAHDDILQEKLADEFDQACVSAIGALESEFGPAFEIDCNCDDVPLPLCGFFRAAVWEIDGKKLCVGAAHEDRECPYLLVLGLVGEY